MRSAAHETPMTKQSAQLEQLLDKARSYEMSAKEIEAQKISFAIGMSRSSSAITREEAKKLLSGREVGVANDHQ